MDDSIHIQVEIIKFSIVGVGCAYVHRYCDTIHFFRLMMRESKYKYSVINDKN